jgi:hypothetical protein
MTPLIPVNSEHGCVGHLFRTARGFKAYDWHDCLVGTYPNADLAAAALLELATTEPAPLSPNGLTSPMDILPTLPIRRSARSLSQNVAGGGKPPLFRRLYRKGVLHLVFCQSRPGRPLHLENE